MFRARVSISADPEEARALLGALLPEISSPPNPERVRASISASEGLLEISIEARDLSSLRAALNSYLYLVHASTRSIEAVTRARAGGQAGGL